MARTIAGWPDLDARREVHDLVVRFYREVVMDDVLCPMFEEVAEVDWAEHIPRLIDFWCRVLLGEPGYDGYLLGAHARVHAMEGFTPAMLDRWYELFVSAVDDGWRGPGAEKAKSHAAFIGGVLARRLIGADWTPCPQDVVVVTNAIDDATRTSTPASGSGRTP